MSRRFIVHLALTVLAAAAPSPDSLRAADGQESFAAALAETPTLSFKKHARTASWENGFWTPRRPDSAPGAKASIAPTMTGGQVNMPDKAVVLGELSTKEANARGVVTLYADREKSPSAAIVFDNGRAPATLNVGCWAHALVIGPPVALRNALVVTHRGELGLVDFQGGLSGVAGSQSRPTLVVSNGIARISAPHGTSQTFDGRILTRGTGMFQKGGAGELVMTGRMDVRLSGAAPERPTVQGGGALVFGGNCNAECSLPGKRNFLFSKTNNVLRVENGAKVWLRGAGDVFLNGQGSRIVVDGARLVASNAVLHVNNFGNEVAFRPGAHVEMTSIVFDANAISNRVVLGASAGEGGEEPMPLEFVQLGDRSQIALTTGAYGNSVEILRGASVSNFVTNLDGYWNTLTVDGGSLHSVNSISIGGNGREAVTSNILVVANGASVRTFALRVGSDVAPENMLVLAGGSVSASQFMLGRRDVIGLKFPASAEAAPLVVKGQTTLGMWSYLLPIDGDKAAPGRYPVAQFLGAVKDDGIRLESGVDRDKWAMELEDNVLYLVRKAEGQPGEQ